MIINSDYKRNLFISTLLSFNFILPDIIKAEMIQLILKDGSEIKGRLINKRSDKYKLGIQSEYLGFIEIPTSSLLDNKSNNEILIQIEESPDKIKTSLPRLTYASRWASNISGGYNSSSTKSRESKSYSLSGGTEYRGDFNTYTISTNYAYNESSSNSRKAIGSNSGNLDILKDRILNDKLSIYSTVHYNFDQTAFAGKHRLQKSLGLGYYFLKEDRISLQSLAGPAAIFHKGGEDCEDTKFCGEIVPGWDFETLFKWKINEKLEASISDVYSLASMNNLTGANYLRTNLRFRPYTDKDLFLSLFFENSHYEFRPNEPRNRIRFEVGKRF